jgi:hypothetical protein
MLLTTICSRGSPLRQEGMLIDDTGQKAEILNKQYHSVFTPECENDFSDQRFYFLVNPG